jgi:putative ABC transport system ATP-binding protein
MASLDHDLETASAHYTPKSAIEHVLSLFRAEREDFFVMVTYSIAVGLLSLVVPIGVQTIVNTVAFTSLPQPVMWLSLMVLMGLIFSGVFNLLQIWVVELMQQRIFVRVAIDLARRIPRYRAMVYRNEAPPELLNRFFEVVLVQKSISKIFLEGISVLLQALIGLTILSLYHPFLLAFATALLCIVFFIVLVVGRGAVPTAIHESSAKHSVLIWLENLAENPLLYKSSVGFDYGIKRADDITSHYVEARQDHFKILMRQHIGFALVQAFSSAGLLSIGGYLVINEQLTLGQLVAAELIVSGLLGSLLKTGKLLESFYDLVASTAKLDSLIQLDTEVYEGDALKSNDLPLSLSIRDLSLQFSTDNTIFDKFSLEISAGDKVAILGENATGKSVLANLLFKLENPTRGVIELSGQNILDLNPSSVREKVALIRGVSTFRGTVEDNLRMGRKDITFDEIRNSLHQVGLLAEVELLPDGIKTRLSEGARPLSRGQASRLMIARALLMNPKLLILDEALDILDRSVVDYKLLDTLKNQRAGWTLIVMTHDPLLAHRFSKVYEIAEGKIKLRERSK